MVFLALHIPGEVGISPCAVEAQVYVYWSAVPGEVEFSVVCQGYVGHFAKGCGQLSGEGPGVGEDCGSWRFCSRSRFSLPEFVQPVFD